MNNIQLNLPIFKTLVVHKKGKAKTFYLILVSKEEEALAIVANKALINIKKVKGLGTFFFPKSLTSLQQKTRDVK